MATRIQESSTGPIPAEPPATHRSAEPGAERYDVLVVDSYETTEGVEKSSWTRVGVAFPHRDGLGLNVELKAIPVSGKLVIRRHEPRASRES